MRYRATWLVATLGLGLTGCFPTRRQLVLPPAPQAAAKPLPQPQLETPPVIETPQPQIDIPAFTLKRLPEAGESESGGREAETPHRPPRRTTAPVTPTTPEAEPTPTPPPTTTPVPTTPQLSEIMTDDRRRQYEADFTRSVAAAKAALSRTAGRRLNARQRQTVQRINTFLQQAEESKVKDLATAFQLARRADLLGQDLLKSLQ